MLRNKEGVKVEKERKLEIEHPRINEFEFDSPHPTVDQQKNLRDGINSPGENRLLNERTAINPR